jgi:peptidase A4-like protein
MLRRSLTVLAGLTLMFGALAATGAASASVTTARPAHAGTGPMIRVPGLHGVPRNQAESSNWSGYAASSSTYTSVSANWTQPAAHCSSGSQYSAFWVGLDGYNSSSVEQTGSEADCSGSRASYSSWYEMYPANPVYFSNATKPGDSFSGSVTYNGSGAYTLVLTDHTQNWTHTVHASLNGAANSSAEAIVEAPCCKSSGQPLNLTNFGSMNFSSVTVDGSPISNFSPTEIVMVDGQGRDKDTISSSSDGDSFTATWVRQN